MSFGKKWTANRMAGSGVGVEAARSMTVDELCELGRFGLRLLARRMGVLEDMGPQSSFGPLSNKEIAEYLFERLKPHPHTELLREMNEIMSIRSKWGKVCSEFAKVLKGMR